MNRISPKTQTSTFLQGACLLLTIVALFSPSLLCAQTEETSHRKLFGNASESWLYGVGGEVDGTLYRIATTASGGFVEVETVGETGFEDIFGIAFVGDRLFGIDNNRQLLEINPDTAATSVVGNTNTLFLNALEALTPTTLIAADSGGDVYLIDINTAITFSVGRYESYDSSGDLTKNAQGVIYGSADQLFASTDYIGIVDPDTGMIEIIGDIGFDDVFGMANDPTTDEIFAVADGGNGTTALITIDPSTGVGAFVGTLLLTNGIGDLSARSPVFFQDGFESGDLSQWSSSN